MASLFYLRRFIEFVTASYTFCFFFLFLLPAVALSIGSEHTLASRQSFLLRLRHSNGVPPPLHPNRVLKYVECISTHDAARVSQSAHYQVYVFFEGKPPRTARAECANRAAA